MPFFGTIVAYYVDELTVLGIVVATYTTATQLASTLKNYAFFFQSRRV